MAITLEFQLTLNNLNGQEIAFVDTTNNYGGANIGYSDVKAVRFLFQNYLVTSVVETLVVGDTLKQYFEYLKVAGSPTVYNSKTISSGSIYIPFSDQTVNAGDEWETLGVYSPLITSYLPTVNRVPFVLSPADWGISETVYPDTIYGLQYEIYKDTTPSTLTNVTNEVQYMVVGSGTCVYNGNTYYEGEVFIAETNGSVSFTGSANLKQLVASRQKYYTFIWELKQRFYSIVQDKLDSCDCDLLTRMGEIHIDISALDWANDTQRISISTSQQTIFGISDRLTQLENT
jgi:hypothetical protein